MYKKTVTYRDFDGNERTEDVYFNLTKTEMIEFALELPDGVSNTVDHDSDETDTDKAASKIASMLGKKGVFNFIKDLILKSYGIRKEDGRRFEKTEQIRTEFAQTMAFESVMDEFMNDDIAAANFVKAVIPNKVSDKIPDIKK